MFVSLGQLFIPQQRKLMGSSAQNSSGVDWCRGGSGSTRFRRQFRRFPRGFRRRSRTRLRRRFQEALVQQVRFDLFRNLLWNPVEPDLAVHPKPPRPSGTHWTWLGFAPKLLRNLLRSVEPDLALHQSLPDLLRESSGWPGHWLLLAASPEPSPEPCWTWPGSAPKPPGTFSGTWLARHQDLLWNLLWDLLREPPDLLRNFLRNPVEPDLTFHQSLPEPSPEPSSEPCWTWPGFAPKPPRPSLNLLRNLLRNADELSLALHQSLRRRFRRRCGRLWCRAMSGFNKVPEKVPDKYPDKVPGGFGAEPVHVQQGSGEGFGEGLGGLVQSQVRFNRGSAEYSGEGSRKPWCKAKSGSTGSGEGWRNQCRWGSFNSRKSSWGVSSAWLPSTLQKRLIKIKRCGCWGYHRRFFWVNLRQKMVLACKNC